MRKLILVRHSLSKLDPALPPHQWELTKEGKARCVLLAEQLALHQPGLIITSEEPKAVQTGELTARELGIPCIQAENLHEHRRAQDRVMDTEVFLAQIEALFAYPDQLVYGLETAQEALVRFKAAIKAVMAAQPETVVAIVSHGTVMSLYYGAISGQDPAVFWHRLGIPGFYVVSWPDLAVLSQTLKIATS